MFSWDNCLDLKIMEFGSKDDLDDDDILPDTNIDRERTTTGRWAIFVFFVSATFMTVAMVSPNWIEADQRFYGTKVQRVGLWVHCFRSFPDYNDPEHQRFYAGCRWLFNPFTPGYDQIRNFLVPRKALDIYFCFYCVGRIYDSGHGEPKLDRGLSEVLWHKSSTCWPLGILFLIIS